MTHPRYRILQITEKNGNRLKEVVSKSLMFKCDAERVANYQNAHWGVNTLENKVYWVVEKYTKGE